MSAFRQDAVQRFRAKLAELIANHTGDCDGAGAAAQSAIEIAHSFHIRRECDVAALVEIAYSNSMAFPLPELPRELQAVLWDYSLAPDEKLARFRVWAVTR